MITPVVKKRVQLKKETIISLVITGILVFTGLGHPISAMAKNRIKLGVLMANDTRQEPVNGFKSGMADYEGHGAYEFTYTVLNANNQKHRLPALAQEIIAAKPDIAVAAGGIEADALMAATRDTPIPVVFLSVSSAIDRGLASTMTAPDKNITGIETNDTRLTAKRLWFIKRILPGAKTVFCFHIPSNVPSVESIRIARKKTAELGLTLIVREVETVDDIREITEKMDWDAVDVMLLNPVAVIHGAVKTIILPKAMAQKIPIFGYGMACIKKGAFASYAGSRYANGKQAARLAYKITHGEAPKNIPIETPEKYEFIINQWMVNTLGLKLQSNAYKMADQILEIAF